MRQIALTLCVIVICCIWPSDSENCEENENVVIIAKGPCWTEYCGDGMHYVSCQTCGPLECVDSIEKPEECCKTCPNGPNCAGPKGKVIPYGDTLVLSDGRKCKCVGPGMGSECV